MFTPSDSTCKLTHSLWTHQMASHRNLASFNNNTALPRLVSLQGTPPLLPFFESSSPLCSISLQSISLYISCILRYGVASVSRLLKTIGLFCKRDLYKRRYSAKETYAFKEPTNRSHPISLAVSLSYSMLPFPPPTHTLCLQHAGAMVQHQLWVVGVRSSESKR